MDPATSENNPAHAPQPAALIVRNLFALLTALLFLLSFFLHSHHLLIRGVAYCFGAFAYLAELIELTKAFRVRRRFHDIFMAVCFGGLYLLLAASYLMDHYAQ